MGDRSREPTPVPHPKLVDNVFFELPVNFKGCIYNSNSALFQPFVMWTDPAQNSRHSAEVFGGNGGMRTAPA